MADISICIATYKRTQGLRRLLQSLDEMDVSRLKDAEITVAIADNDREPSSREVVSEWGKNTRFKAVYAHEPRRGIPYARNRCCALAEGADFIAFIDDDEVADRRWLEELLKVQKKFDADVVVGPVLPEFETDVPDSVRAGFERARYPTGTPMRSFNTGNVLIRRDILRKVEGPFATSLAFSGGTDTFLGLQLYAMGARIIWADEAKVTEINPAHRLRLWWHLRRAFRSGGGLSIQLRFLKAPMSQMLVRGLKCLAKIGLGTASASLGWLDRRRGCVKGMLLIAEGIGGLAGIFGLLYNEYADANDKCAGRWQWLRVN